MALKIVNLGCRLNAYEGEVMRAHAGGAGLDETIVINTCAVTGEAVRQARQEIRRHRQHNPLARIVVTGCAAQLDPQAFAAMPEVDHVLGNQEKLDPRSFTRMALGTAPRLAVAEIMSAKRIRPRPIAGLEGHTRGFLQIQQGCDHRCTFCIIPFARGNNRSLPPANILAEARAMVEAGIKEIVLTGVDIGGYGGDLPGGPKLGQIAGDLLRQIPELARLRLSSLDPAEADEALWHLVAEEPRLMPHFHLSLQSGDDLILKRMKRRHSRADAIAFCRQARALRPDIAFGADLIAGFPTESEAMFENSLSLVEDCGLSFLHVFPYSARAGTPAARMPQVAESLRRTRAARLRAAGRAALDRFLAAQQGRLLRVLVEAGGLGHAENFATVEIDRGRRGEIAWFRAGGYREGRLIGRRLP
jgi:threonylcarbamoyladenosine tRNA methylthiotransferase MtaB